MTERILKLREFLTCVDTAILITSAENRLYFTGFKSSAGAVLITKNSATLLVDFRYFEAARKSVTSYIDIVCYKKVIESINEILIRENIKSLVIEEQDITVSQLKLYQKDIKVEVVTDFNLSDKILDLRTVKSDHEIECIKKAQNIAEKSFAELLNIIKIGVSEKKLAVELEYFMKKNGADRSAFDIIAVSGNNSSLPHGVPTDKLLCDGEFITFDFGAVVDGYHSDMTRTIALGYVTDRMKEVYDTVLRAHTLAADTIKAGVCCADVDNAARDYITDKGYGDYFGHTTGHGVGLNIHEKPTVYKTNKTVLKPNVIITVEPGIYIPGEFGVRIEDMYRVTENGFEDLAMFNKELLIL